MKPEEQYKTLRKLRVEKLRDHEYAVAYVEAQEETYNEEVQLRAKFDALLSECEKVLEEQFDQSWDEGERDEAFARLAALRAKLKERTR